MENILRRTQNGIIIPYHAIDKIVESLTLLIQEFFQNETIQTEVNKGEIRLFILI